MEGLLNDAAGRPEMKKGKANAAVNVTSVAGVALLLLHYRINRGLGASVEVRALGISHSLPLLFSSFFLPFFFFFSFPLFRVCLLLLLFSTTRIRKRRRRRGSTLPFCSLCYVSLS